MARNKPKAFWSAPRGRRKKARGVKVAERHLPLAAAAARAAEAALTESVEAAATDVRNPVHSVAKKKRGKAYVDAVRITYELNVYVGNHSAD